MEKENVKLWKLHLWLIKLNTHSTYYAFDFTNHNNNTVANSTILSKDYILFTNVFLWYFSTNWYYELLCVNIFCSLTHLKMKHLCSIFQYLLYSHHFLLQFIATRFIYKVLRLSLFVYVYADDIYYFECREGNNS
jgi:hypothetical protein